MPAIFRNEEFDNARTSLARSAGVASERHFTSAVDTRSATRAARAELIAERQAIVLSIVTELLAPANFERALDGFVGSLKKRFDVTRISLALINDSGSLELSALSPVALKRLSTIEEQLLLRVMEECLGQERIVCFSDNVTDVGLFPAHHELSLYCDQSNFVTVPMYLDAVAVGVLFIEKHDGKSFPLESIELLEHITVLSAPILSFRRDAARSAVGHLCKNWNLFLSNRFGTKGIGIVFLFLMVSVLLALTTLISFSRSVTAEAELVPLERRLITAPFDGFIAEMAVEPGDDVIPGQLLAQLEQRELELEVARRDGDIASAEAQFRSAMASHDRQATAVARSRLERERALRALVDQKLERIELRAPIAGLVVSANTADAVGAPVRRGETLFEIAKPEGYEVHIMVHERDIRDVQEGQKGTLSLRARPREKIQISVHTIHPVAERIDGVSLFRILASLEVPVGITPRPGESGVAKLNAGKTNFLHLWGQPISQHLTELWWRFFT